MQPKDQVSLHSGVFFFFFFVQRWRLTVEKECHGLANSPSKQFDDGNDKQGDLDRRSHLKICGVRGKRGRSKSRWEHTATEIDKSSLSFTDTDTAVKCSAALPTYKPFHISKKESSMRTAVGKELLTIGSKIKPTHSADRLGLLSTIPLILSTKNSAVTPTRTVSMTIKAYGHG